ncbi:hypothetical protein TSUD_302400 [Trifolium subterraneum]|uniref:Retrotransposon gag domain-containing protein n=1 Tax=Trifolium subterraneum TaxID=3900 RepID=A0A2Z6PGZ7_TRISU|nr:hypothetical protein TSUD_302400 [Trifolium subterraneum]
MAEEDINILVPPPRRTLGDYGERNVRGVANLGFQPVNPVTFDIKNTVISALKEDQYSGSESQCPNLHLSHFYDACDYTDPPGISESDKRLRLFKFSLTGRAKDWLDTIPPGTIATWQELERKFKDRYFPIHKFLERRSEIMNFEQGDGETLYDAWERFKLCLKKCPDHGIDDLHQMQYFTQGLRPQTRMLLDASAGASLKNKNEVEAKELIETMAHNEYRAQNDRGAKKKAGILELDTNSAILAQMKLMTSQIEELKKANSKPEQAQVNKFEEVKCDFCRGAHENGQCFPEGSEQAKYLANFRKSYPNNQGYGWGGNQSQGSNSNAPPRRPSSMEESINKFIQATKENVGELKSSQITMQKHHDASIKNLETQLGQLSRQFSELLSQGSLGGNTKDNPRNESCKKITLRNREVPSPKISESHKKREKKKEKEGVVEKEKLSEEKDEGEVEKLKESENEECEESENEGEVEKSREKKVMSEGEEVVKDQKARQEKGKGKESSLNVKLPYPRKKKAKVKDHSQFKKFMKLLNTLQLNVPLVEALEQMPLYSKFLKELLSKKRKPLDDDTVDMTEECNAMIQRKLPQNKKDPCSFTIPCSIGNLCIGRALCDLGSSINLMSLTMMKKIPGAVAKPTRIAIIFGGPFHCDWEVESLLLGRPFLATGRALIDVEMGELMLRTDEEKTMFNVFEAMKRHDDDSDCFRVDVIEEVVENVHVEEQPSPPLERVPVNSTEKVEDEFEEEIELCLRQLEVTLVNTNPKVEVWSETKEEDNSNPAIISSSLARLEEAKLLRILRANKEATGWKHSDLQGSSPTHCMHKVELEERVKSVEEEEWDHEIEYFLQQLEEGQEGELKKEEIEPSSKEEEELVNNLKKDNDILGLNLNGVVPAIVLHNMEREDILKPMVQSQDIPRATIVDLGEHEVMNSFETDMVNDVPPSIESISVHENQEKEEDVKQSSSSKRAYKKNRKK